VSIAPSDPPENDPGFDDLEALAFVLDQMPVGIVLVDGAGLVSWMNRQARERVGGEAELQLCRGRLAARWHAETVALERLVQRVVGDGAREPETIALPRSSPSAAPLVIVARRIERSAALPAPPGTARAVLFLSDADHQLRASRQRLRRLYDLTPAECELTALLASGLPLRAAAEKLAITHESARTYLKRALQKTGTRRQAELVRLVLSVATAGADEA
jgi:DNA-binding CsgD family transcriptional regulator